MVIEGYVCLALFPSGPVRRELIFGRNIGRGFGLCQTFETSLAPFTIPAEAEMAQRQILQRFEGEVSKVALAQIRLVIFEDEEQCPEADNLVVVLAREDIWTLIGRFVEGLPSLYPLPGACLIENGFRAIATREEALDMARDIRRQADSATRLATFELQRILSTARQK